MSLLESYPNFDSSGFQFNAINGTNTYVIYAQSDTFSIKGNCTEPPATGPTQTVTINAQVTEICRPVQKEIFDIHDTIWIVKQGFNEVQTCNAPATETITATQMCTVTETETVAADTVTVTLASGSACPVCPGASPSAVAPVPPPATAKPMVSATPTPPFPVHTTSKNMTTVKPTAIFSSGASSVRGSIAFIAGLAVIAAFVM